MATRCLFGSCLLSLTATGVAVAQVVVLSPPIPVLFPAPVPVVIAPPSVAVPAAEGQAQPPPRATEQRNYPAGEQVQQPERRFHPSIVHERHYLSPNMNVSNYLSAKPEPTYGPETRVVIRDFYITDEPPKSSGTGFPPPPVGTADDQKSTKSSPESGAPRNSTAAALDGMLNRADKSAGVNVPHPSAADNGNRGNTTTGEGDRRANYPASESETYGPPAPPTLSERTVADGATRVVVASRNGGTPMAEMELNFVDLAGKHQDVKGRTDGKGQFQANLPQSRWQVFMVVGDDERRSLGVILVKPTPGEPFKLQF
jgi:hypothetical protein